MLSPEDVAWADSCLSKDPDMLDAGWNSLKDALFEALNTQQDPSPYEREDSLERDNMDVVPDENTANSIDSAEEKTVGNAAATTNMPLRKWPVLKEIHSSEGGNDDVLVSDITPVSIADTSDRAEPSSDGISNHEDAFWSKHKMEDIFLPTYDENLKDLGQSDPEADFVFQEFKLQQSTEEIFKIWDWDFNVPSEESDLIKQLHKALDGNSVEPAPPFADDSETWKGLQDRSVDDLISGIVDLTLSPNSDQQN